MASLLPRFERHEFVYKSLDGTPFHVSTLVSKTLMASTVNETCPRTVPLLVHFHGGGLIQGVTLEPAFLSMWMLELAEAKGAVVVDPAYRLMPEASGADILRDVEDFWTWLRASLPAALAAKWPGLTVDLDRIAACGESAGGYLALQSALLFPQQSNIRIVMAQYPAIHPDLGMCIPRQVMATAEENKLVTTYIAECKGRIRLGSKYPWRPDLTEALWNTGHRNKLFGNDARMTLAHGLRVAETVPPLWIAQGDDDHLVPRPATDRMVEMIREARPEMPLLYSVQPGDHGFDNDHGLAEPWVAEAMTFVQMYWP